MVDAEARVRAQMVLRSILAGPIDRANMTKAHQGEINGLLWRWTAEPIDLVEFGARNAPAGNGNGGSRQSRLKWAAYRVAATVSWGPGRAVSAETVRLGKE
jgi:hypothetical protein